MKKRNSLILIYICSFLVRSLFFINFLYENKGYFVCSDSAQYNDMALSISQFNTIADNQGNLTSYRVPGYSLFLGLIYKVFGTNILWAILIQILLSSFIPVLIYFLSLAIFPQKILLAIMASIFSIFNLSFVLASDLIMSDSLFLIFFLLFLILLFDSKRIINNNFKLLLAGVFLGIASLIRPVGHFLLFISLIIILLDKINFYKNVKKLPSMHPAFAKAFRRILCLNAFKELFRSIRYLFAGWFIIVFPWLLRNFFLTGAFVFHTMPGYHFLTYYAAEIDCQVCKTSYSQSKDKLLKVWENKILEFEQKNNKKITELEKYNLAQNVANQVVKNNFVISVKHSITNIFKTMFSLNSAYLMFIDSNSQPNYTNKTTIFDKIKRFLFPEVKNKFLIFFIYFEIFFLFFIWLGFILEFIRSLFDKNLFFIMFKSSLFIALFLVLTLGSGVARLRLPIEPILIIFAFDFWLFYFLKNREKSE